LRRGRKVKEKERGVFRGVLLAWNEIPGGIGLGLLFEAWDFADVIFV
jgi:hypothetical protein